MATKENSGIICTKDQSGNLVMVFPVTKKENVDGIEEIENELSKKQDKPSKASISLEPAGWQNGLYSFENIYPSSIYDIQIYPDESCTIEQIEAFGNALILGVSSQNAIKALGEIPKINIPIIALIMKK